MSRYMLTRSNHRSGDDSTLLNIASKTGGVLRHPLGGNRVSLHAGPLGNEGEPDASHREGGRCQSVRLVDRRPDNGQAHDLVQRTVRLQRVSDMLAAYRRPRRCHASVGNRQYLDQFVTIEWIANANAPRPARVVETGGLDGATGIDEVMYKAPSREQSAGFLNCPALPQPRWIDPSISHTIKVPPGHRLGLLAEQQHFRELAADLVVEDLTVVQPTDLTGLQVGAKPLIDMREP